MFSYSDTTENVPHLGDEQGAGRRVALQTSAPRKMTETAVEESGHGAGTAADHGPERGKEPGKCPQTASTRVETRPKLGSGLFLGKTGGFEQWCKIASVQLNRPFPIVIIMLHINAMNDFIL